MYQREVLLSILIWFKSPSQILLPQSEANSCFLIFFINASKAKFTIFFCPEFSQTHRFFYKYIVKFNIGSHNYLMFIHKNSKIYTQRKFQNFIFFRFSKL